MRIQKEQFNPKRWHVKLWIYVVVILINIIVLTCIGAVYVQYTKANREKLFSENVNNVENLNSASANAAYTYISSMKIKLDDMTSYFNNNNLSREETIKYLGEANTNPDRQFQLILSGTYGRTGEISFGDYSGVSVRKKKDENGKLSTIEKEIIYGSGYYDIFKSFTDIKDENFKGLCSTPEFTDPDTKLKCFAVYHHIRIKSLHGGDQLYTLLLAINSETALNAYNMQNEYEGQSTVLINENGDYIIKNNDYRNVNFYDYIVNYNGLQLEKRAEIQDRILEAVRQGEPTTNLFYKNHKGDDCIFSVTVMENDWYSVTCVPLASFNLQDNSINYSFMILVMFGTLFIMDAVAIYFVGKTLLYNVKIANQAQEEANHANQAKSRFLSTMTHELRTPLNAIIGLTSLAGDSIEDPHVMRDYLKKIDISSKLLLQLISDILDISAIESNKIKLNNCDFNIMKLISALSTIYYDQCASKGIEFNVVLKDMYAENLIGDSVRVNQIILNFLSNAVKFTPEGGKITLKAEQVEENKNTVILKFSIIDTGCGVNEDMKNRLFKPFERLSGNEARKYSGTGLGLSITKSLVELMNGQVGVDSKTDSGSNFWAVIPFTISDKVEPLSFANAGKLKILAVVHNDEEREYMGKILAGFDVRCSLEKSAKEALELLRQAQEDKDIFDLCLLDWDIQDMRASNAINLIRQEFDHSLLRIAVLSYDLAEARMQCVAAGADFILGKPVYPSALHHFLNEVLFNQTSAISDTIQNFNFTGKRILLAEDNKMNIYITQNMLKKVGAQVEVAENGKLACDIFTSSETGYFDLILMDIQMPVLDGYEATKVIRASAHKDATRIPILAMTADAFLEDVEKAHRVGMNEHLAKPIVREVMYAVLKKYLC